eukprot:2690884-Prorocentrum_lima.AAC.1
MTFKEIAKDAGDSLQYVLIDLPAAIVWILQKLPGMADSDNAKEISDLWKAMWGLMRLSRSLK